MKKVSEKAGKTLDALTQGLGVGEGRKLDRNKGAYMPVFVNRLTDNIYSVSHYFEQNGDLVPDPDMTFYRFEEMDGSSTWLPVSFQMQFTHQVAMHFGEDGRPARFNPSLQKELAAFTTTWMNNIRAQQGIRLPRATKKASA